MPPQSTTHDYRHVILLVILAGGITATLLSAPFAQEIEYHQFADQRSWLGIPLAADVLSNLAFVVAGIAGWIRIARQRVFTLSIQEQRWLRLFCLSLIATGCGSLFYHAAPDNASLFWDRLPMTITFTLFFCLVLASHVSLPLARRILLPMMLLGTLITLHWQISELRGEGDLRFYAAFQFLPLTLVIMMLMLFESRGLQKRWLIATALAYLAAKFFEMNDEGIFALGGIVSGHTVKHLVAALGAWWVVKAGSIRPMLPRSAMDFSHHTRDASPRDIAHPDAARTPPYC